MLYPVTGSTCTLLELGAALGDDLNTAISSSALAALDDVPAGVGVWLCLGLDVVSFSCRNESVSDTMELHGKMSLIQSCKPHAAVCHGCLIWHDNLALLLNYL